MKKSKSILFEGTTYKKDEFAFVPKLKNCDFCVRTRRARFDGQTTLGSWAYMCRRCFPAWGTGLGFGRGQILITYAEHKEIQDG